MNMFFDKLPIVSILRFYAIFHFVFSMVSYLAMNYRIYDLTATTNAAGDELFNSFFSFIVSIVPGLFSVTSSAIIILAMAEIIKLMKESKKNDQN